MVIISSQQNKMSTTGSTLFILLIIFVNHGILITTADENTDIFASPEISSGSGHVVAAAVPDVDSAHGISSIINANGVEGDDDNDGEEGIGADGVLSSTSGRGVKIANAADELNIVPKVEDEVPGEPSFTSKAKSTGNSITIYWNPPVAKSSNGANIHVRGYTIGWGIGYPDVHSRTVGKDVRSYTIESLRPASEYVISLRAFNHQGDGQPALDTVKTLIQDASSGTTESLIPLLPPMGLKAVVLSASTVILQWTDTSLIRGQTSPSDNRIYSVKYTSNFRGHNAKYKILNCTEPYLTIDDLKANTVYEFSVKTIKGRQESPWSMSVLNTTSESIPASPPRDLTIVEPDLNDPDADPSSLSIQWQPPKVSNGQITGYMIYYSTDESKPEKEWSVQPEMGDKMNTIIRGLNYDTKYFFKIQSRTAKGLGPISTPVSHRTLATPAQTSRVFDGVKSMSSQTLMTIIAIVTMALSINFLIMGIWVCTCRKKSVSGVRSHHHHHSHHNHNKCSGALDSGPSSPSRGGLNPPDLWIHHEHLELKSLKRDTDSFGPDLSCDRDQADLTPVLRTFQDCTTPLFSDSLNKTSTYTTLNRKMMAERPSLLDFDTKNFLNFNHMNQSSHNNPHSHTSSSGINNDHGSTCSSSNYNTAFY